MNYALLLFMHHSRGLPISEDELAAILSADPNSSTAVRSALKSARAAEYFGQHPDWAVESMREIELGEKHQIRWSHIGADDYPKAWLNISVQPYAFNYWGEPSWVHTPMLAVVGSRNPSHETLMWMQREMGRFLRHRKIGVVSGGARGVDEWAHRISIDEEIPTICVLPSGLLNPYPPGGQTLWSEILAGGGCLLSTMPLREGMRKSHFHIRNRWIAGMARGVFVAEANRRSGSAMTAKYARDEGIEVATLPVSPHSVRGLGNLDLLADGATMLRESGDLQTFWERRDLSPRLT